MSNIGYMILTKNRPNEMKLQRYKTNSNKLSLTYENSTGVVWFIISIQQIDGGNVSERILVFIKDYESLLGLKFGG